MGFTIFCIVILGIAIGLDIAALFDNIRDEKVGAAIWTLSIIVLCGLAMWVNIQSLNQELKYELKYPTVETKELPRVDTLITQKNSLRDTTYIIDFKPEEEK